MLGFIFPGQGSQQVGMLTELATADDEVLSVFQEGSDVLGYDLWRLVQEGPQSDLDQTEHTQPAMLAAGYAVWRVWCRRGAPLPKLMAGHSLGEYTALVCGGALPFAQAISLVAERGRFMQEAVPEGQGAMAAILGLTDDQVNAACVDAAQGQIVSCANLNSFGQIVIAGQREAVERAVAISKAMGSKRAVLLSVSVPSHCELMRAAADRLGSRLAAITMQTPTISVIHNADVKSHTEAEDIKSALVEQVYRPVRWVEVMQSFVANGVSHVVECGPGKVLAGLCRRIDDSLNCHAVYDTKTIDSAIAALQG